MVETSHQHTITVNVLHDAVQVAVIEVDAYNIVDVKLVLDGARPLLPAERAAVNDFPPCEVRHSRLRGVLPTPAARIWKPLAGLTFDARLMIASPTGWMGERAGARNEA